MYEVVQDVKAIIERSLSVTFKMEIFQRCF